MATSPNSWRFDREPTGEDIEEKLKEVPAWHGSDKMMNEYSGFVISIAQKLGKDENFRKVWRLYTTVAGKIAILHDAHNLVEPMPITEAVDIDYKQGLVVVKGTMTSPIYGTVFEVGTGVMGEGAGGADKTNPIENAMTSWRGRAASALVGAGILPYTGIASAEEVQSAQHRDEMADRGYRVVTPAASEPRTNEKNPVETAFEALKRTKQWDDAKLEEVLGQYLAANPPADNSYEGSGATEYFLSSRNVNLVTAMVKWYSTK